MKNIIILMVLMSLFSCRKAKHFKTVERIVHDTTFVTITEKQVDTVIEKETLTQEVYIECDSNNKPVVSGTGAKKGKRSSIHSKYAKNILVFNSECDSLNIVIKYKDSLIRNLRTENTTIKEKTIIEKKKGFWQRLKSILLHVLYSVILIAVYEFLRRFTNYT